MVRTPWLLLTENPDWEAVLVCSCFPDSKDDDAGKLMEMILLVLMETVGRGTVSDKEGVGWTLDLLTTLVTRDVIDDDAMATVEIG